MHEILREPALQGVRSSPSHGSISSAKVLLRGSSSPHRHAARDEPRPELLFHTPPEKERILRTPPGNHRSCTVQQKNIVTRPKAGRARRGLWDVDFNQRAHTTERSAKAH